MVTWICFRKSIEDIMHSYSYIQIVKYILSRLYRVGNNFILVMMSALFFKYLLHTRH